MTVTQHVENMSMFTKINRTTLLGAIHTLKIIILTTNILKEEVSFLFQYFSAHFTVVGPKFRVFTILFNSMFYSENIRTKSKVTG